MGEPLQKAILELNVEVKTMTRDVNMDGPLEIDNAKMDLQQQVACLRRKNFTNMSNLLSKFKNVGEDETKIVKKDDKDKKAFKRENKKLTE